MVLCSACRNVLRNSLSGVRRGRLIHQQASAARFPPPPPPEILNHASKQNDLGGEWTSRGRSSQQKSTEKSTSQILKSETTEQERSRLKIEFQYLHDPVKLNTRIRYYLANDNLEKAVKLLRHASSRTQSIVAWNGVVDYLAVRREFKHAFSVFNEMKKRGQFPDAFTYSLLFRGLAQEPVTKQQTDLAMQLYRTLEAENSKVQKNALLINAALQVFVNARDWESMWTVAADFSDKGPCAPHISSYGVLLNGLRKRFETLNKDGQDDEPEDPIEKLLGDAARIWRDMLRRKAEGQLDLDDRRVGDYLRILELDPERKARSQTLSIIDDWTGLAVRTSKPESGQIRAIGRKSSNAMDDSKAGNVLLSITLRACMDMLPDVLPEGRSASDYWAHFTKVMRIQPDLENYHMLLRYCQYSANSSLALHAILDLARETPRSRSNMPTSNSQLGSRSGKPTRTTWLLAMRTCANAMEHVSLAKADSAGPGLRKAGADVSTLPTEATSDHQFENRTKGRMKQDLKHEIDRILQDTEAIFRLMVKDTRTLYPKPMVSFLSVAFSSRNAECLHSAIKAVQGPADQICAALRSHDASMNVSQPHGDQAKRIDGGQWETLPFLHLLVDAIKLLLSSKGQEALMSLQTSPATSGIVTDLEKLKDWSIKLSNFLDTERQKKGSNPVADCIMAKTVELRNRNFQNSNSLKAQSASGTGTGMPDKGSNSKSRVRPWAAEIPFEYKQLDRFEKFLHGGWRNR